MCQSTVCAVVMALLVAIIGCSEEKGAEEGPEGGAASQCAQGQVLLDGDCVAASQVQQPNGSGGQQPGSLPTDLGSASDLTLSGDLTFNEVYVNISVTRTVTMTNNGDDALALSYDSLSTPFSLSTDDCATLQPEASCAVTLTYAPTQLGEASETFTVNFGTFTKSLNATATAVEVEITQDGDFGSLALGSVGTKTFTMTNPGNSDLDIELNDFAHGFTLDSHDCTPLLKKSQCTIGLNFSSLAIGTAEHTVGIEIPAVGASLSVDLTAYADTAASLSLDDPSQEVFENVIFGFPVTVEFTLSNIGGLAASAVVPAVEAPFALQSTTCGAVLASDATCVIVVEVDPQTEGTFSESLVVGYHDGVITQTASRVMNAALGRMSVVATYANAPQWLDYALSSNGEVCDGDGPCLHGGEHRTVAVGFYDACDDLTMEDSLQAFGWSCHDLGATVEFRSTRLKPTTRLEDLLIMTDPMSFKSMAVSLKDAGTEVATSVSLPWWSNSVVSLPDTSGAVVGNDGHDLATPGTIYVATGDTLTKGIEITDHKQAIVIPRGSYLRIVSGGVTDAVIDSGSGIDYVWLEGEVQAAGLAGGAVYILGSGNNFWTLRHFGGTRATNVGVQITGKRHRFENVDFSSNNQHGIYTVGDFGTYYNVRATNNGGNGIAISAPAASNTFVNIIVSNNAANIYIIARQRNTFLNTVNANSIGDGIHVTSSAYNRYANTLFLNHTGHGIGTAENSGTNYNEWSQTVALAVDGHALYYRNGVQNYLRGLFVVETDACHYDNGALGKFNLDENCDEVGTTGIVDVKEDLYDISASFVGFLDTDGDAASDLDDSSEAVAFSDLQSNNAWTDLASLTRTWSKHGAVWPMSGVRGRCNSGNCRIFDWRLKSTDTLFLNRGVNVSAGIFTNGAACPAEVHGDEWLQSKNSDPEHTDVKFLHSATEIIGDGTGDDDGLCESNEGCVFSRNLGVYQGHGDFLTNTCVFADSAIGGITGVQMYAYPENGI